MVGIFRSEESAKKTSARLGNPPEDKFVPIVGSVGKYLAALRDLHITSSKFSPATEQDGADLLKRVLEKVGTYTDVLASIGSFAFTTPILEQSLDGLRKVSRSSSSNWRGPFCGCFPNKQLHMVSISSLSVHIYGLQPYYSQKSRTTSHFKLSPFGLFLCTFSFVSTGISE